jgi:hypothetical protein
LDVASEQCLPRLTFKPTSQIEIEFTTISGAASIAAAAFSVSISGAPEKQSQMLLHLCLYRRQIMAG